MASSTHRVLVNHNTSLPNAVTGITVYTWKILEALAERARYSYVLATTWDVERVPAKFAALGVETLHLENFRNETLAWARNAMRLPGLARRLDCDIILSPGHYGAVTGDVARVGVIHDLRRATHPELQTWSERIQWKVVHPIVMRRSAAVIAVSHATGDAARKHYPGAADRVTVVHEASALDPAIRPHAASPIERPYGLMVANITTAKNFPVLVKALERLARQGKKPCICVIGRDDLRDGTIERARSCDADLRIIGSVDDEALATYYAHARFYVNTSIIEGFCLPIVEAQSFGRPVICSDLPVLREVAGDGALFFDPHDDAALAGLIERVVDDDALCADLARRSLANCRRFSWNRAAEEMEQVFDRLLVAAGASPAGNPG